MESKNEPCRDKMDTEIEAQQEPCLLERTLTETKTEGDVTRSTNVYTKNESASFASDFVVQADTHVPKDCLELETKAEIREERLCLERTPAGSKATCSDVCTKSEAASYASDFTLQSGYDILGDDQIDTKIEIKEESVCALKTSSNDLVVYSSNEEIKSEEAPFESEYNIYEDCNEMGITIQIKDEPLYLEKTSTKLKSEEILLEDDLHFITQDNTSGVIGQFILPESSRLDMEAMGYCESDATSTILDKDCLKLRENSSPCHEKSDTSAADGGDITVTTHMDDKESHKCISCGECFSQALDLQTHITTHEDKICDKSLTQGSHLKDHNLIHEGQRPFKCNNCDRSFTLSSNLNAHISIHEDERKYKCSICDKSFHTASHLKRHNFFHEDKRPFKCDKCDKSFAQASDLNVHISIHEDKRKYKCNICDRRFNLVSHFKIHNSIHEGKRTFKCEQCDKSYFTASHLKRHNSVHEGKRPFKCEKCDKSYITAPGLKAHNLIHEGLYKCSICHKCFAFASHLRDHNLVHEGKMPFKCNRCDKRFRRLSNLNAHASFHEEEGKHKCNICDKNFCAAAQLRIHNLIHEGKSSFKCDKCAKNFLTSSGLRAHNLIHEGLYKCSICYKCFSRPSHLRDHSLVHESKS